MVAAATHSLCEAANAMVQGQASEEKLIASAKEVAGSTAALLVACKVKADPNSMAMQRLQVRLPSGVFPFILFVFYLVLKNAGHLFYLWRPWGKKCFTIHRLSYM